MLDDQEDLDRSRTGEALRTALGDPLISMIEKWQLSREKR
jgi:hypothetical protein